MIQRFQASDDLADMQSSLMRDGALIIEQVADSELITTINAELRPAFDAEGDQFANDFNGYRTRRLGGLLRYSSATAQLLEHPLVWRSPMRRLDHTARTTKLAAPQR